MRIISRKTLREFWDKHPDAEQPLRAWYARTKRADWKTSADVKEDYRNASLLPNNRVVFNIKGNDYRLAVAIDYQFSVIYIRFIGTHREYDSIDAATIRGSAMNIKPIRTEADYRAALAEIEHLWGVAYGSPEGDRLDVLVTLVEAYEEKHHPIPLPDPIEAILHYMESQELSSRDLEPYIGSRTRVSEVLKRKRPLSLNMIRKLQSGLGISADVLIQPYDLHSVRPG